MAAATRMLAAADTSKRRQGLERLGSLGSARSVERLAQILEDESLNASERLVAVRALAPHVARPRARRALVRALSTTPKRLSEEGIVRLTHENAAMCLAREGNRASLEALAQALRHEGSVARAVILALRAYPPRKLGPLLQVRAATPAMARALEALGDQRSFETLRQLVVRGAPNVQAAAAIALTRLGNLETVPVARHWLAHAKEESLLTASLEILLLTRDGKAIAAAKQLLQDSATREAALRLVAAHPLPELAAIVDPLIGERPAQDSATLLGIIGRCGGSHSVELLVRHLEQPALEPAAAYALALSNDSSATDALATALGESGNKRWVARAAVVRELVLGQPVSGTRKALSALLESPSGSDRSAGAWGLSSLDSKHQQELLESQDAHILRAAAAAVRPGPNAKVAAQRLLSVKDAVSRTALAIALSDDQAARQVPTALLVELYGKANSASALAALRLAERMSPGLESMLRELLGHGDPSIRAHTALGLGHSRTRTALALLDGAYWFEPEPRVRHAIVLALSRHPFGNQARALGFAAAWDADSSVRTTAKLALAGATLAPSIAGKGALWVQLTGPGRSLNTISAWMSGGVALPAVPSPDHWVGLTHIAPGAVDLRANSGE